MSEGTGANPRVEVAPANLDWSEPVPTETEQPKQEAATPETSSGTTETPAPAAPQGETKPSDGLILGKFKSHDDLAKSYQEIERHKTQIEQERAQYKKQLDQMIQLASDKTQQVQQNPDALLEKFYDDPKYVQQYINQTVEQRVKPIVDNYIGMISEMQVSQVKRAYEDFPKYEQRVAEILYSMPAAPKGANPVEMAYKIAKSENVESLIKEAEERGRRSALEQKQEKTKVFVEGSGQAANGVPVDDTKLWEEARRSGDWTRVIQKVTGIK